MKRGHVAMAVAVAGAAAACGGGFAAGKPWNASVEASIFDDGADLFDDPARLSGKSENSARQALEVRADLADALAIVDVVSVQSSGAAGEAEARRIGVELVEPLHGELPGRAFALESGISALGNSVIRRLEPRLSGGRFVAFIRWFELEGGAVGHHFHLSPASAEVLEIVRPRAAARSGEEPPSGK